MRYAHVITIVASWAFAAGTAFGGDPVAGSAEIDMSANPGSGSGGGSGSGSGTAGGSGTVGVTATAGSPSASDAAIIDEPLALPTGMLAFTGGFIVDHYQQNAPPPLMGTVKYTAEALAIGAGYGITDQVSVGGVYALPINDNSGAFPNAGALDLWGAYSPLHNAKMTLAVGGDLELAFANNTNLIINLGATFRYNLTQKVALFTGTPFMPSPVGQQLSIGATNNLPITLTLPIGVQVQPIPALFLYADTDLASFQFSSPSGSNFIFADFIPIEVGGLYRVATGWDVGGKLSFADLENVGARLIEFELLARYRLPRK
jgi:hypothetical protein